MSSTGAETALDKFGRVVVPRSTRAELGLEPGTRFTVSVEGGEIRLRPLDSESELIDRGGVLIVRSPAEGDLRDAQSREREARIAHLSGRWARK